ncbi:hypothetical protein [Actinorugispora endophytica]|uniref:Uncharacterized protein n=1 Tax=Actinorugispora endophytica TaxID=1605990 RepID=A0A4R6UUE9_9ACTN|nr:hypothetical protein [Actinorugispora endophytica]TDQ50792.1 hypothetical protein EV190_11297 [Actinorugispora endophytica]
MSYPGQPPGGYGGQPPGGYGGPPHSGTGGWGAPPPPPPPPPGGYGGSFGRPNSEPPASQGSAIGALICNGLGLCLCWPLGLIGLILAIIALVQTTTSPSTARVLTLIAWVLFGVSAVIGIIYFALYGSILFAELSSSSY